METETPRRTAALTRQRIAAQEEARRRDGTLTGQQAAYRKLMASGKYAHLDKLPLSASQLAELAIIYQSAAKGIAASRLEGRVRGYLARHHLITPVPGSAYPPDDWRAQVRVTFAGAACVVHAQGKPVTLTLDEAVALAVIERRGEAGTPGWPGTDLALRVANVWRLVEVVHPDSGGAVYRLTPAGREALARQRCSTGGRSRDSVTDTEVQLMREVRRVRRGDLGGMLLPKQRVLQRCLEAGWVVARQPEPGYTRHTYALTEDGEDVLAARAAAERAGRPAKPVLPGLAPTELSPGIYVRLANRKGRDISPEYVKVVRVEPHKVGNRTTYEVWVLRRGQTEPEVYGGAPFHPNIRFHRRP